MTRSTPRLRRTGVRSLPPVFWLVMGGVAVAGLVASALMARDQLAFEATAIHAVGSVLPGDLDHATVEFRDEQHRPWHVTFHSGTDMPSHRVGELVAVMYPREAPSQARIDTFMERWGGPLGFGVIGAAFALATAGSAWTLERVERRRLSATRATSASTPARTRPGRRR